VITSLGQILERGDQPCSPARDARWQHLLGHGASVVFDAVASVRAADRISHQMTPASPEDLSARCDIGVQ
jgi:hypothetical protein